ncbi:hypothetical protein ACIBKY_55375 [Nonomuraea sp. NPDC050394]|uniref:hypothetical protein n=1 Tax=Nonomuraea sp. NPDC050394 TaxID=3364363 RepID=UPI0037B0B12B
MSPRFLCTKPAPQILAGGLLLAALTGTTTTENSLKAYEISFQLHPLIDSHSRDPQALRTDSARVQLLAVVSPDGRLIRLHSRMVVGSDPSRRQELIIFWRSPASTRTELRLDLCLSTQERVPPAPLFDDVLLDTVGPLDPSRESAGFIREGNALSRFHPRAVTADHNMIARSTFV